MQTLVGTPADGGWGPNSRAALDRFLAGNTSTSSNTSELGREIIGDLQSIEQYLNAYNEIHGEKGRFLSNNKGLLGIINQAVNPNSRALAQELGVTQAQVQEITGDNGINQAGLQRFAGIAVLSALLT